MKAPPKRNVTITLDEDVARWTRIKAAEADTSVARLVGDLLRERMRQEKGYAAAMRRSFASLKPVRFEKPGGRLPSRDEIHDREHRRRP